MYDARQATAGAGGGGTHCDLSLFVRTIENVHIEEIRNTKLIIVLFIRVCLQRYCETGCAFVLYLFFTCSCLVGARYSNCSAEVCVFVCVWSSNASVIFV